MNPSVSIIILNYNGKKFLGENCLYRCVSSVLNSDYPNFEVIFFDNGSRDDSVKFIKENFSANNKLKIIASPKNYGYSAGNNIALRYAKGKYVVLLNNDVEVKSNWLRELIEVMEADPTIAIAQSKILSFDGVTIQTAGNVLDITLSTYHVGFGEKDNGQYDRIFEITFASGAALIVRRSLIEKIGMFDPNYFFYHDDCDLCWRARLAGFKIVSVPSSIVYHKGKGTSISTFTEHQHFLLLLASRIGLLIKNPELKTILKLAPIVGISISMDVLGMILKGDFKTPLKLFLWTLRNLGHNLKYRIIVQRQIRKVNDEEVLKTFLDSSIFILRLQRSFAHITGNNIRERFNELITPIMWTYYRNHIFNVSKLNNECVPG
jgi:GT2 family glycosyltransferase